MIGLIRQDTVQIYIGTDTVTYETQEEQYIDKPYSIIFIPI